MRDCQTISCSEDHANGASEWHTDGKLCNEWLQNLERGRFTERKTDLMRRMVVSDQIDHFRMIDAGELIRLEVSLSQTLPEKRGFLQELRASLGPLAGKAKFEKEYGGRRPKN